MRAFRAQHENLTISDVHWASCSLIYVSVLTAWIIDKHLTSQPQIGLLARDIIYAVVTRTIKQQHRKTVWVFESTSRVSGLCDLFHGFCVVVAP